MMMTTIVAKIMRADLERLLISEAELLELTGFDRQKLLQSNHLTPRQIMIQRAIALGVGVISFAIFAGMFLILKAPNSKLTNSWQHQFTQFMF